MTNQTPQLSGSIFDLSLAGSSELHHHPAERNEPPNTLSFHRVCVSFLYRNSDTANMANG